MGRDRGESFPVGQAGGIKGGCTAVPWLEVMEEFEQNRFLSCFLCQRDRRTPVPRLSLVRLFVLLRSLARRTCNAGGQRGGYPLGRGGRQADGGGHVSKSIRIPVCGEEQRTIAFAPHRLLLAAS